MTIRTPAAPAASASVLLKGLSDVAPAVDDRFLLGGAPTAASQHPIPVYVLEPGSLTSGRGLADAHQVGWRYLVYGPKSVGIADIDDAGGGHPQFNGFSGGERARALNAALAFAEEKYQAGSATYEARILEVPALYTSAVWLAGQSDVFIPFMENGKFGDIRPLSKDELLPDLERAAREQEEYFHRDRGVLEHD